MKTLLYIGAAYHLAFVVFHLSFWKLFNWKYELEFLTTINQNVMQILNLRLIYVFLVVACLSFFCADELLTESLGKVILFAVALFWLMRAVEQIVFFRFEKSTFGGDSHRFSARRRSLRLPLLVSIN